MDRHVQTCVLHYWGKAQPEQTVGPYWHPLAYHGLDVAAAGAVLLETRPQLLAALTNTSGLPEAAVRRWLLLALALHDIGKFADCFQCKVPELWHHRTAVVTPPNFDPGHGRIGLSIWQRGCETGIGGLKKFEPLFGPPLSRDTPDAHAHFGMLFSALFPARAGLNHAALPRASLTASVPRTRGAEPRRAVRPIEFFLTLLRGEQ